MIQRVLRAQTLQSRTVRQVARPPVVSKFLRSLGPVTTGLSEQAHTRACTIMRQLHPAASGSGNSCFNNRKILGATMEHNIALFRDPSPHITCPCRFLKAHSCALACLTPHVPAHISPTSALVRLTPKWPCCFTVMLNLATVSCCCPVTVVLQS